MSKNRGIQCKVAIGLVLATLFSCWFMVFRLGVFGSEVDWLDQHSVIPDYFRQLFYKTGNLFPNFALNLGAGQNIFNFSYYGLYSPIILISYFFPSVKMSNYLMVAMIVCFVASVQLFYYWLCNRGFKQSVAVPVACIFMLATPMLYESYNQIMFIDYMPFLVLALIGVDRYFEQEKWGCLLAGVFLMIMTSFYFSIGGMLCLVLYGIYRYWKQEERVTVLGFVQAGMRFAVIMLTAVFLSGILLVPTAVSLMGGRSQNSPSVAAYEFIIPKLQLIKLLYSPYGIGLSTIALTVLLSYVIRRKCCEKFLGCSLLVVLVVPVIGFLLNGGLYSKEKVFIPFLPVICYLMADYFTYLREEETRKVEIVPYIATILLILLCRKQTPKAVFMLADAVVMLVLFVAFSAKKEMRARLLASVSIGILFFIGAMINQKNNHMLPADYYQSVISSDWKNVMQEIGEKDDSLYRIEQHGKSMEDGDNINRIHAMNQLSSTMYSSVYNMNYRDFRDASYHVEKPFRNILMQSTSYNPLFLQFMGVKYLVTNPDKPQPYGYQKAFESSGKVVWKNEMAAPIAYVTNQLMREDAYDTLEFPYNQMALSQYAVVADTAESAVDDTVIREVALPDFPVENTGKQKVKLPKEAKEGDLLFLQFDVENKELREDAQIVINGQKNKLTASDHEYYNENTTFHYVFGIVRGQKYLKIESAKGDYEIKNLKAYIGSPDVEKTKALYKNAVDFSREETTGDRMVADVTVREQGYFISSIPYDENFTVLVDGKEASYEKVNTAFLGFPMNPGEHHIEISYKAPGANAGKAVSLFGVGVVLLLWFVKRRKSKKVSRG